MSVIFLGIPLDLTGITGAEAFFKFEAASDDFCNRSALNTADFGFFFKVKCFVGAGCCPTWKRKHIGVHLWCWLHYIDKQKGDVHLYLQQILMHLCSGNGIPLAT